MVLIASLPILAVLFTVGQLHAAPLSHGPVYTQPIQVPVLERRATGSVIGSVKFTQPVVTPVLERRSNDNSALRPPKVSQPILEPVLQRHDLTHSGRKLNDPPVYRQPVIGPVLSRRDIATGRVVHQPGRNQPVIRPVLERRDDVNELVGGRVRYTQPVVRPVLAKRGGGDDTMMVGAGRQPVGVSGGSVPIMLLKKRGDLVGEGDDDNDDVLNE